MMEKFKSYFYKYMNVVWALVVLFLVSQYCERQKDYDRVRVALRESTNQVEYLFEEVEVNEQKIATQQQIMLTQQEAIDAGLLEIEKLKNVKSQVRVISETRIDTIFAEYQEPQDSANPDKPRSFIVRDPWYSLNGLVLPTGIAIRELQIKNDYSITIADKKLGFFKTTEPSVILVNKNPYTSTQSMENVVIVRKEPFYRKPWFWTSVGVGVGLYINRK